MTAHLNKKNQPTIVNISKKKQTTRIAKAQGIVNFSKKTFKAIESFKTKIVKWKPQGCTCRLCKVYIRNRQDFLVF